MFWFINTKKKAEIALTAMQGVLSDFPVEDLDYDALAKKLLEERIVVASIEPFYILIKARQVTDAARNSPLWNFVPSPIPEYRYYIQVSTWHMGEDGGYYRARAEKGFDSLHDLMKWLVGR